MDENPYESPKYVGAEERSLDASLPHGEEILRQIAARSEKGRGRHFRLRSPMIGKLVLTNQRVFFLSSGKGEGIGLFSEVAMIERIAKSLDITALQRSGSWEFSMSDIRFAEAPKTSFLQGPHLRLVGLDECGTEVHQRIYRCGIGRGTWADIAARINEMRHNAGNSSGTEPRASDRSLDTPDR
jgi:hypothetical protein